MNVKDKVILVTGGAGGLGAAIGKCLAENGAEVYLLDLDEQRGAGIAGEIVNSGGRAHFKKIDLTSEIEWKTVVDDIVALSGRIDVLVNNAGINIRKPIEEMSIDEWQKMMLVNTGSVFLGCKYSIPVMRRQGGGVIINTSSVCGLIGHKYTPEAYTATKGAVTLLTKAVASRYARYGIRCNSIHPSTVLTPLTEVFLQDPERRRERFDEVPLGRLATVEDVAYAVLYLASDEASFINGVSLPIDGGVTCC
ncbi:MAG: glucose 1-dehydrogenase [Clostridiaceae bacterium]|nr:glucose 1-dehydrogenase [Clostridiaceae bacterium]HPU45073.1 glucose 1-dehydrogenase [Thermoclostridium sp.]